MKKFFVGLASLFAPIVSSFNPDALRAEVGKAIVAGLTVGASWSGLAAVFAAIAADAPSLTTSQVLAAIITGAFVRLAALAASLGGPKPPPPAVKVSFVGPANGFNPPFEKPESRWA